MQSKKVANLRRQLHPIHLCKRLRSGLPGQALWARSIWDLQSTVQTLRNNFSRSGTRTDDGGLLPRAGTLADIVLPQPFGDSASLNEKRSKWEYVQIGILEIGGTEQNWKNRRTNADLCGCVHTSLQRREGKVKTVVIAMLRYLIIIDYLWRPISWGLHWVMVMFDWTSHGLVSPRWRCGLVQKMTKN